MLLITEGAINTICATLQERSTLTTHQFLFVFTNDATKESTSCVAVISDATYSYRITQLTITEKSNATTAERKAGSVSLQTPGVWHYQIYEQADSTNLDYTLATTFIEEGKCLVSKSSTATFDEYSGASSSTTAYSGNS